MLSVKITRDVLVPAWITGFGVTVLAMPALGVAASLALFVVGVCVVPAAVLIEGELRDRRLSVQGHGVGGIVIEVPQPAAPRTA